MLVGGALLLALAGRTCLAEEFAVQFQPDIQYGTGGGEPLLLNLARPKLDEAARQARGPLPAVVCIHGGGWQGGNRSHFDELARQFAARGYVAATISYRLAPKHVFPAQIEDCKCAVRWLRAKASELGVDPERIGAVGGSAGAHLAMMLAVMDPADGLEGEGGWPDQSSKVQAAVSFVGPTNLVGSFPPVSTAILHTFLGGSMEEKLELYRKASPITYVNAGDAPLLLFAGTKDPLVPYDQAFQMTTALHEAGVPGRVELLIGAGHGWAGKEMERTLRATFEFLDEQLGNKAPPPPAASQP
ncbi:MAG: alpha/beta hydrolase [Pirellulales bacterium]|nr:alpha/beta hydrolase [Pirellulales bacterium]